jgi:transcriptional regulator with XRE-family HTH domain
MKSITDELRAAIRAAEKRGITRYQIAKESGVRHSAIGRIAIGENIPRLDTAEKIAKAIGLRLTIGPN